MFINLILICVAMIILYYISDEYIFKLSRIHTLEKEEMINVYNNSLFNTNKQSLEIISHNLDKNESIISAIPNINRDEYFTKTNKEKTQLLNFELSDLDALSRERIIRNELDLTSEEEMFLFKLIEPKPQIGLKRYNNTLEDLRLHRDSINSGVVTNVRPPTNVRSPTTNGIINNNRITPIYNEVIYADDTAYLNMTYDNKIDVITPTFTVDKQNVHDRNMSDTVLNDFHSIYDSLSSEQKENNIQYMYYKFPELNNFKLNEYFKGYYLKDYVIAIGERVRNNEDLIPAVREAILEWKENGYDICLHGKVVKLFGALCCIDKQYGQDMFLMEQLKNDLLGEASKIYFDDDNNKVNRFIKIAKEQYAPKFEIRQDSSKYISILEDCIGTLRDADNEEHIPFISVN